MDDLNDFDLDDEGEQAPEDAKGLRAQLGKAHKQIRQLTDRVLTHEAEKVLGEKGFDLVKPEDLKGVALDEIETRAAEIQQEREALQADLMRAALKKQGFDGEELEEMLSELVSQHNEQQEEAQAVGRARAIGAIAGAPVPRVDPSKLQGYDAIRAGLDSAPKKR